MFKIPPPNFTQTPNILVDEWLPHLGLAELKVLMVIMRKTFGWHKVKDRISLTQLQKITGLERKHVIKGVKSLVGKGLISKVTLGKNGFQETYYELCIHEDSNNFTQCPKDPPPSVLKTPTKETTTKEKRRGEEAQAPPPPSFSHKRVNMSQEKIDNLLRDFGSDKVNEMLERLDEYADINPKRFKQYACHAAVIRKWIREDKEKTVKKNNYVIENANETLAHKIIDRFKAQSEKDEIQLQDNGLLFCYGRVYEFIKFSEFAFKEMVFNRLRKMGLSLEDL